MTDNAEETYPLFEASGRPKLPEHMSCKEFEVLLKNWHAQGNEDIQTYLKSLDPDAQCQAIEFMKQVDEEAKRQANE